MKKGQKTHSGYTEKKEKGKVMHSHWFAFDDIGDLFVIKRNLVF